MNYSTKKFDITTKVRSLLMASEKINTLVGTKIYPLKAPIDTEGDFITYAREQYSIVRNKMGITSQTCRVSLVCVSDDYDKSQEMIEAVFDALEGNRDGNIYNLVDSTEDFADEKYIQVLLYEIV